MISVKNRTDDDENKINLKKYHVNLPSKKAGKIFPELRKK